ncbi:MAG: NADP-dependent oxidoreductase [Solirubrobacteraceae bacterium]
MRGVRFREYGDVDVLHVEDVPEPEAGPGEVVITVRAAGVNPIDWKILHGLRAGAEPLAQPRGLGVEAAGVVEQVGPGVEGLSGGEEVLGVTASPAFAERAACGVALILRKPPGISWEVAGSASVVVGTAYKCLELLAPARGDTLLLLGASGGVGMIALQMAVARGVRVIGTASPSNQEFVRRLGALPVPYGEGWEQRVRELAPDGIYAVLDTSGHGELAGAVELAGGPERVLTIAAGDAAEYGVPYHAGGGGAQTPTAVREVLPLIEAGRFSFPIAARYDLDHVGQALRESEHGHPVGKLVVVP